MLHQGCQQTRYWQANIPGCEQLGVSVNLSAIQLAQPHLPSKQSGEQGPWGERVPSITMKGTITLDKSYGTFTEFLQGIGVLSKPGPPTQEEFQKALDGWAESMRQRREQAEKAEQQRLQELEQLQKQQQQEQQNQQPQDQQNQQPQDQQAPTVLVPDGNRQTDPGSDGGGQAPPTPPAGDGQAPAAPSSGAPEVAGSGTAGSPVDGNATGALASEMAGTDYTGAFGSGATADYSGSSSVSGGTPASSAGSTDFGADSGYGGDYTGAYDSGGTADYSGGYATDFGAGDASCACF